MGYWFVGMELRQICSDGQYFYGNIDNVSIRPYANVQIEFFYLPKSGDGVFLDGNDMLHVPAKHNTVYVCMTPPILKVSVR